MLKCLRFKSDLLEFGSFTCLHLAPICHQLLLGAWSCQSHAGRVSAARRGGNFFLESLSQLINARFFDSQKCCNELCTVGKAVILVLLRAHFTVRCVFFIWRDFTHGFISVLHKNCKRKCMLCWAELQFASYGPIHKHKLVDLLGKIIWKVKLYKIRFF